ELEELVRKMNAYLPNDIRIFKIKKMDYAFNARFDAVSRTYKYYIATQKQPYNEDFCLLYSGELDVEKMNRAAARMYEYSDFASFTTAELGEVNNFRCNLMLAYWKKEGDYLVFTIKANRFLRNMVRCVVGTLLAVGKGTITEDDFVRIIEAKDRKQAMSSALAKGLFLENIEYKDLNLQR
ncbi:MAG: tRNA pseudouridine synthase A, partial [Bacteroidales bacterium]|nr:tRNA pseudouridine synthase A [Bacteroidales bacterium]